jgi:signal transduction histidine kinase
MESVPLKKVIVVMEKFDDTVEIQIKDKGSGIDAKLLDKIFDPFFTTKPKGTGLGLAITHKIIQLHKGGIQVSSHPGLGTEFKISFPLKM